MIKRILSIVLAFVLVIGVVPVQTFANDAQSPSVDDSYSLEGDNSFGKMISKAIEESNSVSEGTDNCHICDISLTEDTAKIDMVCDEDCQIVVTLCDEDSNEVLASGIQRVSEGDENAVISLDERVPDNYVVKATIVDDKMHPIAPEYVDNDNTRWHEEFEELKTTDFDSCLVLNLDDNDETNFAVLREDVSVVEANEEETIIENNNDRVVFETISSDFSALANGDVFCYNKEDPDNMILGRVTDIDKKGSKTVVTSEEVEMSDVFDIVKIQYDDTSCDIEADADSVIHDEEEVVRAQGVFEGEKETYVTTKQKVDLEGKLKKWLTIKGTMAFETGINLKIEWNAWKLYAYAMVKLTPKVSLNVTLEAKKKMEPKEIAHFNIPVGPTGLTVKIKLNFILEATVSFSVSASISQTKGFSWSTSDGSKNLSTNPVITGDFKIEGKIKFGVEIVPEITALSVVGAGLKGELAIEVTASSKGSVSSDGKKHDCKACIAGDVSFVTSIKFTIDIDIKIWNKEWDVKLTGEIKVKLFDWYWSITYGEANCGKCPHYSYKTTIKVVNEQGKAISGAMVDGVKSNSNGEAVKYYSPGTHKIKITASGYQTVNKTFDITNSKKTINVKMKAGSSSVVNDDIDASVGEYSRYKKNQDLISKGVGYNSTYVAPLTFSEPAQNVVLSTSLASQRRSDVAWVQRELKNLGYDITADGYYGNRTAAVVRKFQQDYSLPVTGTVNANVVAVIKKPIKAVSEPGLRLITSPDIPSGGIATVSWDSVANASDYNVYVYNNQGQLVASAIGTKANTASFVLYEAGEYMVKAVSGNERFTSTTATLNQIVYVHNPSLVTFVDWDGTVLSKQFVEYGKSAVTPASPERDGFTFSKWDKPYTNLADTDLTVTAQYAPNRYTVKFMDVKVNGSDKENEIISDKYYYGESAQAPDPALLSVPQGYSFIGWDKDYSMISEDITIRPVLEWANNDLPIEVTSYSVSKDQGYGYDVTLTIQNYELKRTTGRVVVALKTETGRFITMTESSAFTLAKSNASGGIYNRETFNIFVPCKENVAYVDIFVVAAYSDLIPISEVKSIAVGEATENEGVERAPIVGQVDASLAGKQAILFIYKIDEAADYTNEYIGQSVIRADGSYSFDYRLREEPTPETGDYTVVLGIEGSDGAIFLDTINAPRKSFTVTIKDADGSIIDTQVVSEGDSATLPTKNPEREGFRFAGWDYSNSSIHEDLTITAIYVPKTYTVVFIDWTNERYDMKTYQHGEPIDSNDLALSSLVDYEAVGWEGITEGMPVTENMVITAKYEKKHYLVQFFDYEGNVVDEQTVSYGEEATVPELLDDDIHVFYGWNADDITYVTESLEVYPYFSYTQNTSVPVTSVQPGVYNDTVTVLLTCEEEAADIYYALNDGEFVLYTTPIQIDQTVKLTVYASSFGKNDSSFLTSYYVINRVGEEAEWEVPVEVFVDGASFGTYLLSIGSVINASSLPVTKVGHSLEGFYYDSEMTQSASDDLVSTSTAVLYANLVADSFTVQFKDADGTILDTQTVSYLAAADAPEMIASENGLIFVGWDTDDYYGVTEDLTVTAVYADEDEIVGITLNRNSYTMMEGYSYTLVAQIVGSGINEVFWESSDESLATVDDNGKITALSNGLVLITATALGETSASATCYVLIERNPECSITLQKDSIYTISEEYICGISPSNNTVAIVQEQIQAENIKFFDGEAEMGIDDTVKTGCTVTYFDSDGNELDKLVLVVTGDADGDGLVSNRDASHIMRHIINKEQLETCFLLAADVNADGNVNNRDASLILKVVAQKASI